MSGPAFRDGDGGREGGGGRGGSGDDGVPRVPYQRDRSARNRPPDDDTRRRPPHHPARDPAYGSPRGPAYDPAYDPARDATYRPPYGPRPVDETGDGPQGPAVTPRQSRPDAGFDHHTLKSLLGAWALTACSREEALAVEEHLTGCAACAEEALRLRDAVSLLHREETLDLDPLLRARVLEGCLGRRPARIPVPEWAGPYDAEAARLDALLRDLGDSYWKAPVELRWFEGAPVSRRVTVEQVIAHLTALDSLVGRPLGLPEPGGDPAAPPERASRGRLRRVRPEHELPLDPWERTAAHWAAQNHLPGATLRSLWREQTHNLVRTVSFAGQGVAALTVEYGVAALPLRDAFVDRAFECWMHAADIAEAVDYPYEPPAPRSLNRMVDLAARLLPDVLAERRRAGLTTSPSRLVAAGRPGRSLLLEIDGPGGGEWYLPLDSPGALASPEETVAHVAMDSVEFCRLAAGRIEPEQIAAGQLGDRAVIRDVLFATASLSRM
ncbi:maleylpyruvate isomerase N-terminal domain-containing protein [Actinacidiphila acididurans]|uniref:Zf-HC2 domain-containing protein n=1 Tax=Actinacidiphila acididurans TaxID=2784346 RepID=A0ABS2TRJ6_9ACTN|nr:zf-HC2 domain-containing protein [Actinacidiphila acididurans]MBM9505136.1 zf-HC2 domain-containing protein [Actinacidiphila acididurans]